MTPKDRLILITIVKKSEVTRQFTNYYGEPMYESLLDQKTEEIGRSIQESCYKICEQNNIVYSYMFEYGDENEDLADIIAQEHIDMIVIPKFQQSHYNSGFSGQYVLF